MRYLENEVIRKLYNFFRKKAITLAGCAYMRTRYAHFPRLND